MTQKDKVYQTQTGIVVKELMEDVLEELGVTETEADRVHTAIDADGSDYTQKNMRTYMDLFY